MVFAALVAFVLLAAGFYYNASDANTEGTLLILVCVWLVGFLATLIAPDAADDRLMLTRVVWGNSGAVAISMLAPDVVRILLLSLPLFGVLYAALQLKASQLMVVTGATVVSYLICAMASYVPGISELETELGFAGVFAVLTLGMHMMAVEVVRIRRADRQRTEQLNEVLQQVSNLAMRDDLTGLYNRRYLQDVLTRQKALGDRGQMDFTVCFCDLDLFKRVNDCFGHSEGDRVLHRFACLAEDAVRSVDVVARWGGEEFLLVLVGANAEVAARVADRLRCQTSAMSVGSDPKFVLTVSIGVASFEPGESIERLIARADHALYRAKSLGRDRVLITQ